VRHGIAAAAAAALALALAGCQGDDAPFARVSAIGSLDQAIGGPSAAAREGDFLLENDQIRAVVEKGEQSYLPTDVGGTLIDIDLQRPQREWRSGRGLDQLGQIAPMANLSVAKATDKTSVRITHAADAAEVTVAAEAAPVFRILLALTLLIDQRFAPQPLTQNLYTEYRLKPGERFLHLRTTLGVNVPFCPPQPEDQCNAECDDILYDQDCHCPSVPARCRAGVARVDATTLPDRQPARLLDVFLGDLPRPMVACSNDSSCDKGAGEKCVPVTRSLGGNLAVCRKPDARDAGLFLGDVLVFGAQLTPFVRGIGYDTETDVRRVFDQGKDTLSTPLVVDGVFATGDRVSLGYGSPAGTLLVPIFRGPFSLGATHAATCPTSQQGCLDGKLITFERWISVGEGDVASAQEPLLRAAGITPGVVRGRVTQVPDGAPRSGVSVFALRDPRALACDAACVQRCGAAGEPEGGWTLDALRDANRCRTRDGGLHPDGTSAVESMARTDRGTDPVRDGDFNMALPAGAYFLVASDGRGAFSTPAPVTVAAGATVELGLQLAQPATLEYTIIDDDRQQPGPGKITIGQLPGAACANDGACDGGATCQAGRCALPWKNLVPLELGGERTIDGVQLMRMTATGKGEIQLPPGDYDVVFSRGPFYSIDRKRVTLDARRATQVVGAVKKVVDRKGWVSIGLHEHAKNSVDSGVPLADRVTSFLAEDMDVLSSSDHDFLTPYDPVIRAEGVADRINTMVGVEITTQEYGHYLAYPLRPQMWKDGQRLPGNNAEQWRFLPPGDIIAAARKLATGGNPIIHIPHPYDYFDFYTIDPTTLKPADTLLSIINPLLSASNFSGDFDVMELANTKNFHRIRRPTVSEVTFYGRSLDALTADLEAGRIDGTAFSKKWLDLASEATRRRLHRTVAEQEAHLAGQGEEIPCLCSGEGDCATGQICDAATLTCLPSGPATTPPPADALCVRSRGVLDDWFTMMNHGVFRTGVGGDDTHDPEAGFLRTLVMTGGTTPPYVSQDDVVAALRAGRTEVTTGPIIHFTVNGANIGDTVSVDPGAPVELAVRVEKAPWFDVDRLEIYRNGHLIQWANGCERARDTGTLPCLKLGDSVVAAFDEKIADTPDRDSWYVVVVYGLDGRSLAPVYRSQILAEINTPEITRALFTVIPGLKDFKYPRSPSIFPVFPFAATNPIRVDVGGDGWSAPQPAPSWCRKGDIGC
jgi:hypothetical protein